MIASADEHHDGFVILVVDDSAEDRALYKRLLSQTRGPWSGVVEAETGARGLELLDASRAGCVLLDFRLPDLDGLEFLAAIDRRPEEARPPVVMLTGQGSESVAVEAMKRGAQDYLVKDELNAEALARAVRAAVERVAMRRTLERQRKEIERSNRELEQYAHVVAHGLRSPLLSIITAFELIERSGVSDEARAWLAGAGEAGRRMRRLIDDILAHSRITGATRARAPVDCAAAVDAALDNLRAELDDAGAEVEVKPLPVVFGDETQIIQVFENLVGNAIKFRADRPVRIAVACEPGDGRVLFSVSDNGIGLPAEHAERVFHLFERLHAHDERPGSGVGLATCKKIVESHGGLIWVESEPGEGATFYFSLPTPEEASRAGEAPA